MNQAIAIEEDERSLYVNKNLKHNRQNFIVCVIVAACTAPFASFSVIVPNLALRLGAPNWVATLAAIGPYTLGALPVFFMGWLLHPAVSRKRSYAGSLFFMYLPLLVFGAGLAMGMYGRMATILLTLCTLSYSFFIGITAIPCWDLYAKIFPEHERGRVMGKSHGTMQAVMLLSAPAAGWMVSETSLFAYPLNYTVGLGIAGLGGMVFTALQLRMREYVPKPTAGRSTFKEYVKHSIAVFRKDTCLRRLLYANMLAATCCGGVAPLLLVYGKSKGGLSENGVGLYIALIPLFTIPLSLLCGKLVGRIGAARVTAGLAALSSVGLIIVPQLSGLGLIAPMILAGAAVFIYSYGMLAIINHAPEGENHTYLALLYATMMLPGLVPLLLSNYIATYPTHVFILLILLLLGTGGLFLNAGALLSSEENGILATPEEEEILG